ncbi:unnamed protein product [Brassica oleracea]|uniref:F-actin-capping protein subunit alpha n=1 Tax=Brassica napus TaxID=3708 RepID=A0A816I729_BRANA|nr:unnamed protein product [Brassica napus]
MADEKDELQETELSYDQKKEIAKWFLLNAPAGEINYVAKDLKEVLSDEEVYNEAAMEAFPVYNKSHMICLEMPSRVGDVIVSSFSEITENEYLDPRTAQVAIVDHVKQICSKVRPAYDEELPSSYIEEFRSALDAEIQRYVSESYPKGVSTVNSVKGKDADGPGTDFELVVLITARKLSPQNFCNGSWRSVWHIDFQDESQVLDIKGKVQVGAHYFEEGNVELDAKKEFQDSTIFQSADDCAIAIANIIRHHETEYLGALEVAYSKLPDNTFKDLRRKLPVTRTLFPWQNTLQFSLTREVEKELGLGNNVQQTCLYKPQNEKKIVQTAHLFKVPNVLCKCNEYIGLFKIAKSSDAGNRTRVSWVKARYPNRWTTSDLLLESVDDL